MAKVLAVLFLLLSCNSNQVFEEASECDGYLWKRTDEKVFFVNISDTAATYIVKLNLRFVEGCPYKTIWCKFTNYLPRDSTLTKKYGVEIRDKDNNYIGDGMGDIWDCSQIIESGVRFNNTGIVKFGISHLMEQETVGFIAEVGLVINKISE
jgi:gliding motility-associated lipoprotein GldH